jgi:DNA-binding IclR family transcriptional regulator
MSATVPAADAAPPSVLWKAFDVLEAFSQSQRILTLSEIARRSGLPKSTVHRILIMLLEVEAVERVGPGYKIGLRMFTMGTLSLDARVRDAVLPYLERLRRTTRQTVHLAMLQDSDVVYLDKLTSPLSPDTPALIGGRLPAHRTGVGKALLAFGDWPLQPRKHRSKERRLALDNPERLRACLEDVRRLGIATDREEAAPGLSCIAMPILSSSGRAVVAISVAFAASQGDGEVFVNPLRETVAAVSRLVATSPYLTG